MNPKVIRTHDGYECNVIEILRDGVLVDWTHVGPDRFRYIRNGDYEIVEGGDH